LVAPTTMSRSSFDVRRPSKLEKNSVFKRRDASWSFSLREHKIESISSEKKKV
jgi:hypothetical protein